MPKHAPISSSDSCLTFQNRAILVLIKYYRAAVNSDFMCIYMIYEKNSIVYFHFVVGPSFGEENKRKQYCVFWAMYGATTRTIVLPQLQVQKGRLLLTLEAHSRIKGHFRANFLDIFLKIFDSTFFFSSS